MFTAESSFPVEQAREIRKKKRQMNFRTLTQLASEFSADAISTAATIMNNDDVPPLVRLKAVEIILNRSVGAASSAVVTSEHLINTSVSDADLRGMSEKALLSMLKSVQGEVIDVTPTTPPPTPATDNAPIDDDNGTIDGIEGELVDD